MTNPYPSTRIEDLVEEIHGKQVPDPYRWLEDNDSDEVKAWDETQNKYARQLLDKLPGREALHQRLEQLMYLDFTGVPRRRGKKVFYIKTKIILFPGFQTNIFN